MSTPVKTAPETLVKKESGLSKMVTRMSSLLKKKDGSKRFSLSGRSTTPATAGLSAPVSHPTASGLVPATAEPDTTDADEPKRYKRSEVEAERARKLAERYKLTIVPSELGAADKEIYRIEKPIRMRIHRTCHKCNTPFGASKTCRSCHHTRCKDCPRFPAKKPEGTGKAKKEEKVKPDGYIEPDPYQPRWENDAPLTIPSKKPGAQPLVRKKPKQRIRRTCHECSTLFMSSSRMCSNCGHERCTDCPRDPPKKHKYPDGYPGDAFSAAYTGPIKYACHKCLKVYPPTPQDSSLTPDCTRCGHTKCDDCPRARPTKVDPIPDPEVVKQVEAKLAALKQPSAETT